MSALRPSWTEHCRSGLVASLRTAAELFPKAGADGARIVHDTRKELKRAASIARMFAPIIGSPAYSAIEIVDAARRQVGRARDLDILPRVLAGLKCEPLTRDVLMRAIALERGKVRGDHASGETAKFTRELLGCAETAANWDLGSEDPEALVHSLRLTYRAAKRRGRAAWASEDANDLHDLRTHVVDLGHQCALFEPVWPDLFAAYGAELHRLRQSLGDHNDLTVLGEFALSRREVSAEAAEHLVALVLRARRPVERRARSQFERLFAERPGAFARRIGAYIAHPQHKTPAPEKP